jgi:hypothetical protein
VRREEASSAALAAATDHLSQPRVARFVRTKDTEGAARDNFLFYRRAAWGTAMKQLRIVILSCGTW